MYAAPSVATAIDEDGSALLLNTSIRERDPEFLRLTPEVGLLWEELLQGRELQTALHAVASAYEVPLEQIKRDMQPCIDELQRRRMLIKRASRRPPVTRPTTNDTATERVVATASRRPPLRYRLLAAAALVASLIALRLLPLRVTLAIIQAAVRVRRQTPTLNSAKQLVVCARSAARRYPGNTDCLEISIAALLAGAVLGKAPGWRFGTTFRPLHRHAWVQVDNTAIDHVRQNTGRHYHVMLAINA